MHGWWKLVTGPIDQPEFDPETKAYLAEAAQALSWSETPWQDLTSTLKASTGRKGKALFLAAAECTGVLPAAIH